MKKKLELFPAPRKAAVRLQDLIMRHEDQWLARKPRGGLHESSMRLRNTGKTFEDTPDS